MIDVYMSISLKALARSVMLGGKMPTINADQMPHEAVGVVCKSSRSDGNTEEKGRGSQAETMVWSTETKRCAGGINGLVATDKKMTSLHHWPRKSQNGMTASTRIGAAAEALGEETIAVREIADRDRMDGAIGVIGTAEIGIEGIGTEIEVDIATKDTDHETDEIKMNQWPIFVALQFLFRFL